jgi:hypothetical protein
VFIPAFIEAIELARDELFYEPVELPNGKTMQAGQIIRSANLYCFLYQEE